MPLAPLSTNAGFSYGLSERSDATWTGRRLSIRGAFRRSHTTPLGPIRRGVSARLFTRPAPQESYIIAVGGQLAFCGIQALLTPRLVRKNYRSFRVYVVRENGTKSRSLSIRDVVLVC